MAFYILLMPERYFAVHASRLLAVYNAAVWRGFRAIIGQLLCVKICDDAMLCKKSRGSGDAIVKTAVNAVLFNAVLLNAIVTLNLASPVFAQGAGSADTPGVIGFKSPSGNIHCQYFDGESDKPPRANVFDAISCRSVIRFRADRRIAISNGGRPSRSMIAQVRRSGCVMAIR